jgi:AbrB family looped-hinge helix DNA binding protein
MSSGVKRGHEGKNLKIDLRFKLTYSDFQKLSEKVADMPSVKVRSRGQVTIPASIRKELDLGDDATLSVVKVGDVLVLTPRKLVGDMVAKKAARAMKKAGLRLEDLLTDLDKQRDRYNRERYGS